MANAVTPTIATMSPVAGGRVWRVRDIELDERLHELRIGGVEVRIEPKPLATLMVLLRNPQRIVSTAEIASLVWCGRRVNEQVITQCIARLRRSLGPSHQDLVRTVHGVGYRLAAVPDGVEVEAGLQAIDLSTGDTHPARREWKLIEPVSAPGAGGGAWTVEHEDSRARRILLHLRQG